MKWNVYNDLRAYKEVSYSYRTSYKVFNISGMLHGDLTIVIHLSLFNILMLLLSYIQIIRPLLNNIIFWKFFYLFGYFILNTIESCLKTSLMNSFLYVHKKLTKNYIFFTTIPIYTVEYNILITLNIIMS